MRRLLFALLAACSSPTDDPGTVGDAMPDGNPQSPDAPDAMDTSSVTGHRPIVVIFMEDKSIGDITAKPTVMPYLNSLLTTANAKVFTNYMEGDSRGPSLPDYVQTAVGSRCGKQNNTIVAGELTGAVCGTPIDTSIWNQLQDAGKSWGVYMDGMPSPCYSQLFYSNTDPSIDTEYSLISNPAAVFKSIYTNTALCQAHVLPYTSFQPTAVPKVAWISPGLCNNQHGLTPMQNHYTDCLDGTDAVLARGDAWLAANVPPIVNAGATVFITYDEGSGDTTAKLFAVAIDKTMTAHTSDNTAYTHYSLLRRIEDVYSLAPLGAAANATPLPL